MFNIVLHQPEIPPNTGNIIRLCANTGCKLHLIEPLGFSLSDKQLKRAGLDYKDKAIVKSYSCFDDFVKLYMSGVLVDVAKAPLQDDLKFSNVIEELNKKFVVQKQKSSRIFLCSTKATTTYSDVNFLPNDAFVFGPETRGLPAELLQQYPESQKIRIPMTKSGRSLNLASSVSIVAYEAWRQNDFQV